VSQAGEKKTFVSILQEFSIPLIVGVFVALAAANVWHHQYEAILHWAPFGHGATAFGYEVDFHFLVNDIFMVFFFGIAAKEITEACLPGGSLNPIRKAINPLLATIGGVVGPVGVFFLLLSVTWSAGMYPEGVEHAQIMRGWGIPTATDIALAWLVARAVFGAGHPAINFLLLLAVADDAIGLVIIAIFYGDPAHPARPVFLLLVLLAMVLAFGMRKAKIRSWLPYIFVPGPIAWSGLMLAHLHPALALVFIVPFLPSAAHDSGLFVDEEEDVDPKKPGEQHSPLHQFEHQLKIFVDFGLFFFAFANAGVQFAEVGTLTWVILASLVVGKTVGVTLFGWLATKLGFPLPDRMGLNQLVCAGLIAALGLTVALFVAGAAFGDGELAGEAKMGALLSGGVAFLALALGPLLGARRN
jgi:NhaA family Na+:H+ antiporter